MTTQSIETDLETVARSLAKIGAREGIFSTSQPPFETYEYQAIGGGKYDFRLLTRREVKDGNWALVVDNRHNHRHRWQQNHVYQCDCGEQMSAGKVLDIMNSYEELKEELSWLRYFYERAELNPEVVAGLKEEYKSVTGREIPEGY